MTLSPASVAALRQCVADYGWPAVQRQLASRRLGLPHLAEELELLSWEDLEVRLGGDRKEAEGWWELERGSFRHHLMPTPLVEADQRRRGNPEQLWQMLVAERDGRVRAAVGALPLLEKRIIRLRYWEEATFRQIGGQLGCQDSRVFYVHRRALGRLRKMLTTREADTNP